MGKQWKCQPSDNTDNANVDNLCTCKGCFSSDIVSLKTLELVYQADNHPHQWSSLFSLTNISYGLRGKCFTVPLDFVYLWSILAYFELFHCLACIFWRSLKSRQMKNHRCIRHDSFHSLGARLNRGSKIFCFRGCSCNLEQLCRTRVASL